jgi:cell division protein FtsI/penicillin-binding protein 2
MFTLIGRLCWLQLASQGVFFSMEQELAQNAVKMRQSELTIATGRGNFWDRNLQVLTGEQHTGLILYPYNTSQMIRSDLSAEIATVLGVTQGEWAKFVNQARIPQWWKVAHTEEPIKLNKDQIDWFVRNSIDGLIVAPYQTRYDELSLARHLIGYVSQQPNRVKQLYPQEVKEGIMSAATPIGAAGLEKTLDSFLKGIGHSSIAMFSDGTGKTSGSMKPRLITPKNSSYPVQVVTTIDARLQRKIEQSMDKQHIKQGAVAVLDVKHAQVHAMATRPQFDPNHVQPTAFNWRNLAVTAEIPGSIFKTVVAAAALENGVVANREKFNCSGEYGKYGFSCWLKQGHGSLSLREAYARSCNITFAKVMERISPDQLEQTAIKLGLLQPIGWKGNIAALGHSMVMFDSEDSGQLFAAGTPIHDRGVLTQTSIGQRDVRMTPLQAANLVVTLLNEGVVKSPTTVKEIRYADGRKMLHFPIHYPTKQHGKISVETAKKLSIWMKDVVEYGTGTLLQHATWNLAGKSGTAQTGNHLVHQWFIGYGPTEQPKYAVAVLINNKPENSSNQAIALFKETMNILAELE